MAILGQDGVYRKIERPSTPWGVRYKGLILGTLIIPWAVGSSSRPTEKAKEGGEKNAHFQQPQAVESSPGVGSTSSGKPVPIPSKGVGKEGASGTADGKGIVDRKKTEFKKPGMTVQAKQAYLIDLSTNQVLLEKNADQSMPPSSMTKIVTVYLIFQALAQKSLDWLDTIYVSKNAAGKPGSRMFIKPEESISVTDLLKGIVVTSGNDACTAIAEHLGGSEEGFAELMNVLALNLGMTQSHFTNASGLPEDHHYSTCKDLAIIAKRTMADFPKEYGQFYKMTSFKFNNIRQMNRNDLLKGGFADGMKTGMTDSGKYGIVATAIRPGNPARRLLLVLNGVNSASLRSAEARRLLNWGFQRFESLVVPKGRRIATLALWKEGSVHLVTQSHLTRTLPKGSLHRAKITARYHQPLTPPIEKDQKMGELVIDIPNEEPIIMPLVAEQAVLAQGVWDWIKGLFVKKKV